MNDTKKRVEEEQRIREKICHLTERQLQYLSIICAQDVADFLEDGLPEKWREWATRWINTGSGSGVWSARKSARDMEGDYCLATSFAAERATNIMMYYDIGKDEEHWEYPPLRRVASHVHTCSYSGVDVDAAIERTIEWEGHKKRSE